MHINICRYRGRRDRHPDVHEKQHHAKHHFDRGPVAIRWTVRAHHRCGCPSMSYSQLREAEAQTDITARWEDSVYYLPM